MGAKRDDVDAFVETLQKRLDVLNEGKPRSVAKLLEDKERLLVRLKQRLDATVAARTQAVEEYDEQIRLRRGVIAGLEHEILEEKGARSSAPPERKKARK